MTLEQRLQEMLSKALRTVYSIQLTPAEVVLQPTRKEFKGKFTLVTFPFTKETKASPEAIGREIGEFAVSNSTVVSGYNVVKGFLNLEINETAWLEDFRALLSSGRTTVNAVQKQRVMLEYSSPNTNKPLHLGHLRNNFLGWSVAEIMKAAGNEVQKVNLVNDRGIHICKSMLAYQRYGNNETPESAGIKGDKLVGNYYVRFDQEYKREIQHLIESGISEEQAKKDAPLMVEAQEMLQRWEQGDTATVNLWKQMNGWVYSGFDQTYHSMGVDFDQFYYESDTYLLGKKLVEEGLEKGVFFRKPDNSVWADLTEEGLDEKLLLRGDGTSVYITQDLGTADLKYHDFAFDKSIYVVGNEQEYHFKVLTQLLKKLDKPYANAVYHLSYGMVDLPSGKMKSREGTVVDADDLMEEMVETARQKTEELGKIEGFTETEAKALYQALAMGALKYFLLKVDPKKRMLFNPEESIDFKGNTGPFIQYTHARISAILRRAEASQVPSDVNGFADLKTIHVTEQGVVALLLGYQDLVQDAARNYAPSVVAQYAYDIAKAYNRFYTELSIFQETDEAARNFRVALSAQVAKTIRQALGLLGISAPDRM